LSTKSSYSCLAASVGLGAELIRASEAAAHEEIQKGISFSDPYLSPVTMGAKGKLLRIIEDGPGRSPRQISVAELKGQ